MKQGHKKRETINLMHRLKWVYSLFVGEDDDQDFKNSYFGIFDYVTFFVPFLLNRLVVNLLKTEIKLPLLPMLTGMLYVANWVGIFVRHVVSFVLTAALSPLIAIGHNIAKCFSHSDSPSPRFSSSSARMSFTPSTNHEVKERRVNVQQKSDVHPPNESQYLAPASQNIKSLRAF